ncbi:OsmC family protein [Thalassospira sp. MCCC 1A01428]|jgi:putative redox protein|uniref:OsmC family protein n=1 Tax=unclassified Thalassospira TaxID=2648997 RepID=UPI000A1EDFBA|nr:OsmC family protein [Thalassospira sp. MCCC 1A01428]OSQ41628.1 peroxiredoxin [Thalassospira sp. MCCC 1A01428]
MEARVKWLDKLTFTGTSGSGHGVVMDGDRENGFGPSPMEMLLLGVAGCSSIDVVHILQKSRENVLDVETDIKAERAETDPKVFTKIHLHFKVRGENLNEAKIERAVHLSAEKYCSASIMLAKAAELTHSWELLD